MAQRKRFELPDEVPRPRDESYLDRVLGPATEAESAEGPLPATGGAASEGDQVGAAREDVPRAPLVAVSPLSEQGGAAGAAREDAGPRLRAGQAGPNGRSEAVVAAGKGARKEAATPSAPLPHAEKFAELEQRMSYALRPSQLRALRIVYENTVAKGVLEYRVPGPQLASEISVGRRQVSNVLLKLVGLGLIEKEEWKETNNQSKGFILRFIAF